MTARGEGTSGRGIDRSRSAMLVAAAVALAALLAGLPGGAVAQTIVGRVLDQASGEPVPGALLVLVDSTGNDLASSLSGQNGDFTLRVERPGTYRVRAERIGYRSAWSEELRLAEGARAVIELRASAEAITLGSIDVPVEPRCRVRTDRGAAVEAVWEEARKGLAVARATNARPLRYRVTRYRRQLEPERLRVVDEERSGRSAFHRGSPFVSRPAEELAAEGYVVRGPEGDYLYYAPDADALLSDAFLDQHCFRLTADPERPDEVGLAFEPILDRVLPDVRGVLWLDRTSAQLERLEYSYTRLPWRGIRPGPFGGRVEFDRLRTGDLIVDRWYIRMPVVAERRRASLAGRGAGVERFVTAIRETGGEVQEVRTGRGDIIASVAGSVVAGRVGGMEPDGAIEGAKVWLEGTEMRSVTGAEGTFRIEAVPPGTYTVRVSHPSLEPLLDLVVPPVVEVDEDGGAERVDVTTPSPASIVEAFCPEEPDSAMVYGIVTDPDSGDPVAGGLVFLTWSRRYNLTQISAVTPVTSTSGGGGGAVGKTPYTTDMMIDEDWSGVQTLTSERGAYHVCGLPPDQAILARAWADPSQVVRGGGTLSVTEMVGQPLRWVELRLPAGRALRVDVTAAPPRRESGQNR